MQKIKLEERLRRAKQSKCHCPAACLLYADMYFSALSQMSGTNYYNTVYNHMAVSPDCEQVNNSTLFELAYLVLSGEIPEKAGTRLLYRMLAEPFCDKRIFKPKGGKKK